MAWIPSYEEEHADARLRQLYARVAGPGGEVDAILRVHALRPHTLKGHLALYKNVLHHSANRLPKWLAETVGVYVSLLNGCDYCVAHHSAGLRRLLADDARWHELSTALRSEEGVAGLDARLRAVLAYARALTRTPAEVERGLVERLRETGLSDGEVLELNQVVAYFAYANRTVSGLGVETGGETLGLSPSGQEDEEDWSHR